VFNLHQHVCVLDGVFVERDNEALRFSPAQALSRDELGELLERLAVRVARWLGLTDKQVGQVNGFCLGRIV